MTFKLKYQIDVYICNLQFLVMAFNKHHRQDERNQSRKDSVLPREAVEAFQLN